MRGWFLKIFKDLLMEKSESKFLLASMKLLTYFGNQISPLQRWYDPEIAYRKPPVILKIVPEAGYDTYTGENRQIAKKQRRKSTNCRGENLVGTSNAAFGTILRIRKCFQRSKQKLVIYSSL